MLSESSTRSNRREEEEDPVERRCLVDETFRRQVKAIISRQ